MSPHLLEQGRGLGGLGVGAALEVGLCFFFFERGERGGREREFEVRERGRRGRSNSRDQTEKEKNSLFKSPPLARASFLSSLRATPASPHQLLRGSGGDGAGRDGGRGHAFCWKKERASFGAKGESGGGEREKKKKVFGQSRSFPALFAL